MAMTTFCCITKIHYHSQFREIMNNFLKPWFCNSWTYLKPWTFFKFMNILTDFQTFSKIMNIFWIRWFYSSFCHQSQVGPPISMGESEKCLDNLDMERCATSLGCDLYCVEMTKTYNPFLLFVATYGSKFRIPLKQTVFSSEASSNLLMSDGNKF